MNSLQGIGTLPISFHQFLDTTNVRLIHFIDERIANIMLLSLNLIHHFLFIRKSMALCTLYV